MFNHRRYMRLVSTRDQLKMKANCFIKESTVVDSTIFLVKNKLKSTMVEITIFVLAPRVKTTGNFVVDAS